MTSTLRIGNAPGIGALFADAPVRQPVLLVS
jgi:hypothetical protein